MEYALPDLFGEPKPMTVLQEIKVGFVDFKVFVIALKFVFRYGRLFLENSIHKTQTFYNYPRRLEMLSHRLKFYYYQKKLLNLSFK